MQTLRMTELSRYTKTNTCSGNPACIALDYEDGGLHGVVLVHAATMSQAERIASTLVSRTALVIAEGR